MRSWTPNKEMLFLLAGFVLPFTALVIERNREFPVIINPDGVNYAILAREYSSLHLHNAINAYWGPAISWLMALPIPFGVDPLTAYRAINVLVLYAIVVSVWRLTVRSRFQPELRFITLWTTGLMALGWSLAEMTPDLLMVLVMLLLFMQLTSLGDPPPRRQVVAIGLLGGIGYLVKPFGLLFFIVVWTIRCVLIRLRHHEALPLRDIASRWAFGMASFLIVVMTWTAALTWKYGYVTTGTSGKLNLTLVAPSGSQWPCRPSRPEGFQPPPFESAVACLDPSLPASPSWNPLASWADFAHLARNFMINASGIIDYFALEWFALAAVAMIALGGLLLAQAGLPELPIHASVFAVIYVAMYCLVVVNTRYIWPAVLLIAVAGLALVNAWAAQGRGPRWAASALILPAALLLVIGPNWRPEAGIGRETIDVMYREAWNRNEAGTEAVHDARLLRERYGHHRMMSNSGGARWLYVAYFIDSEYYGYVSENTPPDVTRDRLEEFDIQVVLVWGDPDEPRPGYLTDYRLSDEFHDGALKVYIHIESGDTPDEVTPAPPATPVA